MFKAGLNRIVLLVGGIAIKFPTIFNERAFTLGLYSNIHEYEVAKEASHNPHVAKVYCRLPFGIALVMKRYTVLNRPLTDDEIEALPISNPDLKIGNFATDHQGNIVVIDFGHCGAWYIGN